MAQAYGGTGTKSFGQQQLRLGRSESLADFARNLQSQTTGNLRRATESKMMGLNDNIYQSLESISSKINEGFQTNIEKTGINANVARVGSMMTLFFSNSDRVKNYTEAKKCNTNHYSQYFKSMLELGIYLPPSQYECLFLSNKIDENDIEKIIDSNLKSLKKIK